MENWRAKLVRPRTTFLNSFGWTSGAMPERWTLLINTDEFRSFLSEIYYVNPGMTAPQAAGVIHSDFEKGFIRAETVSILDINFDIMFGLLITLLNISSYLCFRVRNDCGIASKW